MNKKIIIGGGIAFIAIASITMGIKLKSINDVNIPKNKTNIVAQDNEYNTYSYITEEMKKIVINLQCMLSWRRSLHQLIC